MNIKENKQGILVGKICVIVLLISMIVEIGANAQTQLFLNGQSVVSPSKNEGTMYNLGVGLGGRRFLGRHLALGGNIKFFPRLLSNYAYERDKNIYILNCQIDYFLKSTGTFRPYIATEIGMYTKSGDAFISMTNFGFAPKLGIQYTLSPSLGFDVNCGYHFIVKRNFDDSALIPSVGLFYSFHSNGKN
jgi:hypothetical protein